MNDAPSDHLQATYERRAELGYAEPAEQPDSTLDRKFEGVWSMVASCLPCEAFLDAGCGDGRYLTAFASVSPRPRLVGVDIAERILATARSATEGVGLEVEYLQGNLEALPLEDASFDLVLCTQVIEHLLDPQAGLAELARVLRRGGRLVISTDNSYNLVSKTLNAPRSAAVRALRARGRRQHVHFPHRAFSVREFQRRITAAELTLERVETFRFHLDPPFDGASRPSLQRSLNRIDKALPRHRFGDIVAVVARRPSSCT